MRKQLNAIPAAFMAIGADLFGNCLLALDATTGNRLWHFQAIHHDLWDYDLVTGPKLLTIRHNGKDGGRRRPGQEKRASYMSLTV